MRLLLASASPRRVELLSQLPIEFQQAPVNIDETPLATEPAIDYVCRMSREKAEKASELFAGEDLVILAADTTVVHGQTILGKPENLDDFTRMMRLLSASQHQVYTSVSVIQNQQAVHKLSVSKVEFAPLTDEQIQWYWQTGEPQDKAGGYGIQGKGAVFIRSIEGSYTGIVGLPLYETAEILRGFGILSTHK